MSRIEDFIYYSSQCGNEKKFIEIRKTKSTFRKENSKLLIQLSNSLPGTVERNNILNEIILLNRSLLYKLVYTYAMRTDAGLSENYFKELWDYTLFNFCIWVKEEKKFDSSLTHLSVSIRYFVLTTLSRFKRDLQLNGLVTIDSCSKRLRCRYL